MDSFSSFFLSQLSSCSRWSYDSLENFRQISPIVQNHLKQVTTPLLFKLIPAVVHLGVLLGWFSPSRLIEARPASSRREVLHTDFLTPPILKESLLVMEKLSDVKAVAQGGYPQAERYWLSIGHSEAMKNAPDVVAAVSITGNFGFQPCSHGDFLGSILGTGIVRDKVGDIILQGEKRAQILVIPELVDFLVSSLNKVGNVPVSCAKIPLLALEYEPRRTKSFKAIEASLRVDAVASAGYKISRSKLVDLIRVICGVEIQRRGTCFEGSNACRCST